MKPKSQKLPSSIFLTLILFLGIHASLFECRAGLISECFRLISRDNLNQTSDGITRNELVEAYRVLSDLPESSRPRALLRGRDPSDELVTVCSKQVPLKVAVAKNRGLLILVKEIPEALKFWEVLAKFSGWRIDANESTRPWWAQINGNEYSLRLEITAFKGRISIQTTFWAKEPYIQTFNQKLDRAYNEARQLTNEPIEDFVAKPSYRYGGNVGYLHGINSVTMAFLDKMVP